MLEKEHELTMLALNPSAKGAHMQRLKLTQGQSHLQSS